MEAQAAVVTLHAGQIGDHLPATRIAQAGHAPGYVTQRDVHRQQEQRSAVVARPRSVLCLKAREIVQSTAHRAVRDDYRIPLFASGEYDARQHARELLLAAAIVNEPFCAPGGGKLRTIAPRVPAYAYARS